MDELYAGLRECGQRFGVNIIGGDTVSSPRAMVINLAILGRVENDACLYRHGARPGDILLVTGDLGALPQVWIPSSVPARPRRRSSPGPGHATSGLPRG